MTDLNSVRLFAKDVIKKIKHFDEVTGLSFHQDFLNFAHDIKTIVQAYESIISELEIKDPQRLPPLLEDKKIEWEN